MEALPGGRDKYVTVVVTAYARCSARRLDAALECVRDAKEAALGAGSVEEAAAKVWGQGA